MSETDMNYNPFQKIWTSNVYDCRNIIIEMSVPHNEQPARKIETV